MGSMSNPNTWPPYGKYNDCAQGICSIYCPQWCYIIFSPPPPPPFWPPNDYSTPNLSPLIIVLLGIVATAFLLISYYTLISKYCKRSSPDQNPSAGSDHPNGDHTDQDQWQVGPTGLDEMTIRSITVCRYRKGDGLIEGTDCAVCLSEFSENENLRLLPKCSHAFHLPCIDTWLKSHSNCPLCRSSGVIPNPIAISSQNSSSVHISSLQNQPANETVVMVEIDPRRSYHHQEQLVPKNYAQTNTNGSNSDIGDDVAGIGQVGVRDFRRSASMGSNGYRGQLLVADILRISEEDEDIEMGCGSWRREKSGGGGRREMGSVDGPSGMRRSVSTGRINFHRA